MHWLCNFCVFVIANWHHKFRPENQEPSSRGAFAGTFESRKKLAQAAFEAHFFLMVTPVRNISVVLFALALSTLTASATVLALAGTVTDAKGQPISGAQISIEGKEGGAYARIVRTNGKGHYNYSGLGEGTFKVTLSVNGAVKASIANVKVDENNPTERLDFTIRPGKAMPQAKGKHYVWVPASTGSNLSGSWLEVDDRRQPKVGKAAGERTERSGGGIIQHIQDNASHSGHP